MNLKLKSHYSN